MKISTIIRIILRIPLTLFVACVWLWDFIFHDELDDYTLRSIKKWFKGE